MSLQAFTDVAARREQAHLEEQLAELDVEHTAFTEDLRLFEHRYLHAVGDLLVERDRLSWVIAALLAARGPHDHSQQQAAAAAEDRHQQTHATVEETQALPPPPPISAEAKALFREAAKRLHPDKGQSAEDRARRTVFMARVNAAYARGDEEAIRQALLEFEQGAAVQSTSSAVRFSELLDQLRTRIDQRQRELQALRASALGQLFAQAQTTPGGEAAFFQRRAQHLALQVQELQEQLQHLREVAHA